MDLSVGEAFVPAGFVGLRLNDIIHIAASSIGLNLRDPIKRYPLTLGGRPIILKVKDLVALGVRLKGVGARILWFHAYTRHGWETLPIRIFSGAYSGGILEFYSSHNVLDNNTMIALYLPPSPPLNPSNGEIDEIVHGASDAYIIKIEVDDGYGLVPVYLVLAIRPGYPNPFATRNTEYWIIADPYTTYMEKPLLQILNNPSVVEELMSKYMVGREIIHKELLHMLSRPITNGIMVEGIYRLRCPQPRSGTTNYYPNIIELQPIGRKGLTQTTYIVPRNGELRIPIPLIGAKPINGNVTLIRQYVVLDLREQGGLPVTRRLILEYMGHNRTYQVFGDLPNRIVYISDEQLKAASLEKPLTLKIRIPGQVRGEKWTVNISATAEYRFNINDYRVVKPRVLSVALLPNATRWRIRINARSTLIPLFIPGLPKTGYLAENGSIHLRGAGFRIRVAGITGTNRISFKLGLGGESVSTILEPGKTVELRIWDVDITPYIEHQEPLPLWIKAERLGEGFQPVVVDLFVKGFNTTISIAPIYARTLPEGYAVHSALVDWGNLTGGLHEAYHLIGSALSVFVGIDESGPDNEAYVHALRMDAYSFTEFVEDLSSNTYIIATQRSLAFTPYGIIDELSRNGVFTGSMAIRIMNPDTLSDGWDLSVYGSPTEGIGGRWTVIGKQYPWLIYPPLRYFNGGYEASKTLLSGEHVASGRMDGSGRYIILPVLFPKHGEIVVKYSYTMTNTTVYWVDASYTVEDSGGVVYHGSIRFTITLLRED